MIELNGIYKLKKIRNFEDNDTSDYKVIQIVGENNLVCEKLNGDYAGEKYLFAREFLIDPDMPDEIYSGIILVRDTDNKKG